ncbi:MAG: hypothetical protein E7309_10885 [Butyrivibrio sp.]|nr:hypothetical protein [Butyrivibrio sp.]
MLKRKKFVAFIMTMVLSMTMLCGCLKKEPDPNAEKIAHLFDVTKENLFYATNLSVSGTGSCNIDCTFWAPGMSSNKGIDAYTATEDINISFTRQYSGTRDYHNTLVIDDTYDQKDTSITSMFLDRKLYDKSERYGYTLVQNVNNGKTNSSGTFGNSWNPIPDIDFMNLLLPDLDQCSLYIDRSKSTYNTVVLTQVREFGFDYYRPFVNAFSKKIDSNYIDDVSYTFDADTNILTSIDITGRYRDSEKAINDYQYKRTNYYWIKIVVEGYEF